MIDRYSDRLLQFQDQRQFMRADRTVPQHRVDTFTAHIVTIEADIVSLREQKNCNPSRG